jgi:beta-glucosidase
MPASGQIRVTVDVENAGSREGAEVVQLYIHHLFATVTQPVLELKGFQRISLNPGEKRQIEITVRAKDLGFYNASNQYIVESGKFDLMVGTSSTDGLRDSFSITGK